MSKSPRALHHAAIVGLFLLLAGIAFPANVVIPRMDLITKGSMVNGSFALGTFGDFSLEFQGGYKFGGSIDFGIQAPSLESFSASSIPLGFQGASIIIRDLFSAPLSLTYFVGQNDTFCSGDGFALFGAQPIMTAYRGYMYFSTGPVYDGIYEVDGTGMRVEWIPRIENLSLDWYLYEDTRTTFPGISTTTPIISAPGTYSTDLRMLLNYAAVKVEAFFGSTLTPSSLDYYFRGGMLFYATNRNVEFLGQIGIPKWDPLVDSVPNINHFYLLVEPRLHLGKFSIIPTFFWHPSYYMEAGPNPGEAGSFDINLNLALGDPSQDSLQGGLESNLRFQSGTQGAFKLSPWLGVTTPGVLWKLKVDSQVWPFDWASIVQVFVGAQAQL
ncbi:MAG TPA: hypothetical protein VMQ10_02735 [Spirochaetia bacterium]|nr:hypothetical protein [Spirochaetia bacterium]